MIIFVMANNVDPDEMLHYVALHLGLYCLLRYIFRNHQYTKGQRHVKVKRYPFKNIFQRIKNIYMQDSPMITALVKTQKPLQII